ncbi:MAG: ComF family protein [Acaryochloridaceae cyanobacterium RU_4_10]|nr:ComF family protein [Acaryochloridaceae cyanobacterium RU_4_10]
MRDWHAALSGWTHFADRCLGMLFRNPCPLCLRPATQVLCQDCTQRLQDCPSPVSPIHIAGLPPLYGWKYYEGPLKQSLAKLKYDRQRQVAEPLGEGLATLWRNRVELNGKSIAVPIPLHRDRERQRGYNQADLIARHFCQRTGLPLQSQGLLRTQSTTAQYGLSRSDRFQNLKRAFALGPGLRSCAPNTQIVLIDDIFTTGATLKAATAILEDAGLNVVALFSVAIAERRLSKS